MLTPPAASIVTVKAVCSGASFFAAIRLRPSCSQRSAVSARQISPRASLAMKLTASGVANCAAITRSPSFSRSSPSQTTTMRPRRISSIASSIVENGLSPASRSLCVCLLRLGHLAHADSSPANGATNRSTYFATTSHSTFSLSPASSSPRFVRSSVSGISETSAQVVAQGRDREADAVEGDRALLDRVAEQLGSEPHAQAAGEAVLLDRDDLADPVGVALDDVAAEPVGGLHRQLEVDPVAGLEVAQRGDGQRLVHRLGLEAAGVTARSRSGRRR